MSIGIVGKPGGTRMVTGSVHYGDSSTTGSKKNLRNRCREARNLETREFPDRTKGRTILIMGQRIKQEIVIIPAVKVRKPSRKSVAVV
jgi:hypothetical protein